MEDLREESSGFKGICIQLNYFFELKPFSLAPPTVHSVTSPGVQLFDDYRIPSSLPGPNHGLLKRNPHYHQADNGRGKGVKSKSNQVTENIQKSALRFYKEEVLNFFIMSEKCYFFRFMIGLSE